MVSKSGCDDEKLLNYICKNYDQIECELNGDGYGEPKKRDHNLCIDCNVALMIDYQKATSFCGICGLSQLNQVYVTLYNHTMQPSRRKCFYKRSDKFKVILSQFFYGGKRFVPYDVMETIRVEIHDETNILYNYTIPITISVLECILKRNELTMYKGSLYYIYFKLSGKSFPHVTMREYNVILNAFNIISRIYDKYKPKGRKSFLNYHFVLKKLLIMLERVKYAKCIPPLKTSSKQNELERVWELITKDPEWPLALRKQKIA